MSGQIDISRLGAIRAALNSAGNIAGFFDRDGNVMRQASILWSELLAITPAMVANEAVAYVRDKQCLFVWNALASRWFHIGGRLVFDDFTQPPAPSAKWEGLKCWIKSGIGIGGAEIEVRLVGSSYLWRYTAGRAALDATTADILHTTNFSVEKLIRSKLLPRNNNKCIMQDGDKLAIRSVAARTAFVTNMTRNFRFGANNTTSDTLIETIGMTTTHTGGEYNEIMRVDSTHVSVLGAATGNKWAGTSSADPATDVAVTNMDSNDSYIHYCLTQSANTDEGVRLKKGFILELIHAGG